jgi:hypothetical protein
VPEYRIHCVDSKDTDIMTFLVERQNLAQVRKVLGNRLVQSPHLIPENCTGFWIENLDGEDDEV